LIQSATPSSFVLKTDADPNCSIYPPLVQRDSSPVIIYLPTGSAVKDSSPSEDGEIIAALGAASNATVVRLNYRLGGEVQFPTPIHDVLAGYDWVKENMCVNGRASKPAPPIGVCGQLIGGTLSVMLGLTESRLGEHSVTAVAANTPIVDWIFPKPNYLRSKDEVDDESGDLVENEPFSWTPLKKLKTKRKKPNSWELYQDDILLPTSFFTETRDNLFRKPANYFDPFASPILYFRSPGADVPIPVTDSSDTDSTVEELSTTRRKVHRNFPPTGSSLKLPDMRISIGDANALYDQNEELVRLLRRSIVRSHAKNQKFDRFQELDDDGEDEKEIAALTDAERRIEFHVAPKTGLWGVAGETAWRNEVNEVGAWFRKVLK
jgi:acetyl esterase/lipase